MKKGIRSIAAALVVAACAAPAVAQTAAQVVEYDVAPIMSLAITSATAVNLTIDNFQNPNTKGISLQGLGYYDFTTNHESTKIVGALDIDMPLNAYCQVILDPPGTGTRIGWYHTPFLGTAQADLITGIGPVATQGLMFLFSFTVPTPTAASSWTRVMTLTVVAQ